VKVPGAFRAAGWVYPLACTERIARERGVSRQPLLLEHSVGQGSSVGNRQPLARMERSVMRRSDDRHRKPRISLRCIRATGFGAYTRNPLATGLGPSLDRSPSGERRGAGRLAAPLCRPASPGRVNEKAEAQRERPARLLSPRLIRSSGRSGHAVRKEASSRPAHADRARLLAALPSSKAPCT
jgi:hypothetical protein